MKLRFSIRDLLWLTAVAGLGCVLVNRIVQTGEVQRVLSFTMVVAIVLTPITWCWLHGGRNAFWHGWVLGLSGVLLFALVVLIFAVLGVTGLWST